MLKNILSILILTVILCSGSNAIAYVKHWGLYEQDRAILGSELKIENQFTTPTLQIYFNADGSIVQLDDYPISDNSRKLAIKTKLGLQLENIVKDELSTASIHGKQWQFPLNSSAKIELLPTGEDGLPDFDNSSLYALSTTSDTLMIVRWIKKDFTPHKIGSFELPDLPVFVENWEFESNLVTTNSLVRIVNGITSPSSQVIVTEDGNIIQFEDNPVSTFNRKFSIKTNAGLQIESIVGDELLDATVYMRQWQFPPGSSMEIELLKIKEGGLPDFDNPLKYVLSAPPGVVIIIRWIQKDFTPYPIRNP